MCAVLFRFAQVEVPWALGPPDGRYLMRAAESPGSNPDHVVVFATLGAPERRRLAARRRARDAPPEPGPAPVSTGRATVVQVGEPFAGDDVAAAWLSAAGEPELEIALHTLNRALHAFRIVTADPHVHPIGREQALVARLGYGAGEQVADGQWSAARELIGVGGAAGVRQRRARILAPQARLAAVLGARDRVLACEELTVRARADLDEARPREAALQLLVALDAALAELAVDPHVGTLTDRVTELRGQREAVAGAAQSALSGSLREPELETVQFTVGRLEAVLRARAIANA